MAVASHGSVSGVISSTGRGAALKVGAAPGEGALTYRIDGEVFGKAIEAAVPPGTEVLFKDDFFALERTPAGKAVDEAHAKVGTDTIANFEKKEVIDLSAFEGVDSSDVIITGSSVFVELGGRGTVRFGGIEMENERIDRGQRAVQYEPARNTLLAVAHGDRNMAAHDLQRTDHHACREFQAKPPRDLILHLCGFRPCVFRPGSGDRRTGCFRNACTVRQFDPPIIDHLCITGDLPFHRILDPHHRAFGNGKVTAGKRHLLGVQQAG